MAAALTALGAIYGNRMVKDTSVGTAPQYNVTEGAHSVYQVVIDNTNNGAKSYLKFWNVSSGVTLGTTDPVMILMAPASTKITYSFPRGVAFSTAISYACVTTPGTGGTTAPSSAVTINLAAG